jgi:hypothetical protein
MRGGDDPRLKGGELGAPLGVRRVQRLVDDAGTARDRHREARISGVTPDDLDVVRDRCVARTVHEADALAAATERLESGETDRAGPEDHVLRRRHAVASVRAPVGARPGSARGGTTT